MKFSRKKFEKQNSRINTTKCDHKNKNENFLTLDSRKFGKVAVQLSDYSRRMK